MRQLLLLMIGGWLSLSASADVDSVIAQIDKNPVMVDEAIRLTVSASGDPSRDAFDSSALLNDFVVGRTSISSRTSIVNGSRSETTTWTTTLFPRQEGRFTIPPFTIEGQQTRPIEVQVMPVVKNDDGSQPARDFYVTTHVDTSEVYLNQQIRYTVKLFLATDIERGSLQAPQLKQAQISQLGDDIRTTEIVNGKRYQVIERNFAVVPQRSGEFVLRGPVFTGEVLAPNTNQRFGFFNRTQTVNRLGPDITLTVKPQPQDLDYHWLPSEFVDINEEWPESATFTVGEPVTRTVTLTAMGVVEEQLPSFPQNYPPGFKIYPDQSRTATVDKDNTLIAQRVESVAVIPTKAGRYVLPEITIPWFNVLTGETEYASLPARSIEVAPDTGQTAAVGNSSAAPATPTPQPAEPLAPEAPTPAPATNMWLWVVTALWLVTLIGLIAVILYYRRRPTGAPASASISQHQREPQAWHNLLAAVKARDIGKTQPALTQWLHQLEVEGQPLQRAADNALTAPLQPHIDVMLASVYSTSQAHWDNQPLLHSLTIVREQYLKNQQVKQQPLPALYS